MFRLLVAFWLLTSGLVADERSVVALEVRGGFTIQRGSAVLIAIGPEVRQTPGRYTLLTASHCVTESQVEAPGKPPVRAGFPPHVVVDCYLKDEWHHCTVNSYSIKGDLALLEADCDEDLHTTAVSPKRVAVNSQVHACGFVLGLDQQSLLSSVKDHNWMPTCDVLTCPTQSIVPGMSGGAVFDGAGEVCGIISSITSAAPWESQYTHADEINRFVKTYVPTGHLIGPREPPPIGRAVPRHLKQ